jgi:hypothetical protein
MFPLSDENPHFLTPYTTYALITLNALAWIFVQRLGAEPGLACIFHSRDDFGTSTANWVSEMGRCGWLPDF